MNSESKLLRKTEDFIKDLIRKEHRHDSQNLMG